MRPRSGFTLIELLIVVVIIGILAAVAVPKFQNTKGKANAASLKTDLKNLASAQESYMYETGSYSTDRTVLRYDPSPGVTVDIAEATGSGWSAKATHPQSFPLTCAIYVGNVSPLAPATAEGQVACE